MDTGPERHGGPADPRAKAPRARRAVSVRGLAVGSLVAFGAIALGVIAWHIWSATQLQRSMSTVITETHSLEVIDELQLTLLMFQRLSNLALVTGEAALSDTTEELGSRMERLLAEAGEDTDSAEEQRFLGDIEDGVSAYLRERERLEASGLVMEQVVQRTRPAFDAVVADLEALRQMNAEEVEEAAAEARWAGRLAIGVGLGALALLVLASVVVAFGVSRYLLRPLLALHDAIARLRAGEAEARVDAGGLRETAELNEGFNELADALMHQREAQLTFLAGVAHDLRNPLSALKLGMRSLGQQHTEGGRERTRTLLDRQMDRLARMVDDLLDAARIESGHLELRPETIDVRDAVADVVRLYAPTSADHQIETDMPPQPVLIEGDALRIEQVVSNLLSNAIKFSPGGGRIEVTVGWEEEDAVLSVADQGLGMERDELRDIFRPFRRRKPESAPGAGLGLSVVHRIVSAHGGTIDVESTPGVGSTFHVRLPRSGAAKETSWVRTMRSEPHGGHVGQDPHRG